MDFSKINRSTTELKLNQKGFTTVLFLSFIPILVTLILAMVFSHFLTKNWMQSLHICRTELLATQDQVSKSLKMLMDLNPQVKVLRAALIQAYIELAAAIASENYAWAARVQKRILEIQRQQRAIAKIQKALILTSNAQMASGPMKVISKILSQDRENQKLLPDFIKFKVGNIIPSYQVLAVKPDGPDSPPIYELKNNFIELQALNVSWISHFRTSDKGPIKWITNTHSKKDSCGVSLEKKGEKFQPILKGDRAQLSF